MQIDSEYELDPESITTELINEGFKDFEIASALSWLDNLSKIHNQDPSVKMQAAQPTSLRIYCDREESIISLECQGYILYLEQAKILTPYSREIIIDCIMSLDVKELSIDDLQWLILMVLHNDPNSKSEFTQLESMLLDIEYGLIH
jgi:Smg protein